MAIRLWRNECRVPPPFNGDVRVYTTSKESVFDSLVEGVVLGAVVVAERPDIAACATVGPLTRCGFRSADVLYDMDKKVVLDPETSEEEKDTFVGDQCLFVILDRSVHGHLCWYMNPGVKVEVVEGDNDTFVIQESKNKLER